MYSSSTNTLMKCYEFSKLDKLWYIVFLKYLYIFSLATSLYKFRYVLTTVSHEILND